MIQNVQKKPREHKSKLVLTFDDHLLI